MASSLETLVENLYDKNDKYKNFNSMKQYFNEHMDLLCEREYIHMSGSDSIERFNHDGLPRKDEFYSKLFQKHLDHMSEYIPAQNVYHKLNCNSF
jgi:hypothetical protein